MRGFLIRWRWRVDVAVAGYSTWYRRLVGFEVRVFSSLMFLYLRSEMADQDRSIGMEILTRIETTSFPKGQKNQESKI
jgi:hypothetical protein